MKTVKNLDPQNPAIHITGQKTGKPRKIVINKPALAVMHRRLADHSRHIGNGQGWSSYLAYVNKISPPNWLSRSRTFGMLGGKNPHVDYERFVSKGNDVRTNEFYGGDCVTGIFGDIAFRQSVYDDRESHKVANGLPELINEKPEMKVIVESVAKVFQVSVEEILTKRHGRQSLNVARHVAIYSCQRLGLHRQREIAEYFSLSHRGSVSSAINGVAKKLEGGDLEDRLFEIRDSLDFTKTT